MRILYSHRIGSRDGQSVHIEELVAALRRAGHDVRVVGPPLYEEMDFGGESRLVARLRRHLPRAANECAELAYNLPAYRRLRRAADAFKPDLIYERYNLFFFAGAWLTRRTGVKLFLEVNSPLAEERAQYGGLGLGRLADMAERFVWRAADRVLAVTSVLADVIAAAGVDRARIGVTPNGIDPAQFAAPASSVRRDPDAIVLGFVGFVRAWHGLDAVIAGMAAEPAAALRLLVVGDGPARPELEHQAASLGIADRVRFTGLADRAAIPDLVSTFDVALQPRVVAYASPLKLFEYMAAGRAIVAPDQPNIREVLEDGETALLFDERKPGALWRAIIRLAADPGLRRRLGTAARDAVTARDLTWDANARRITEWAAPDRRRDAPTVSPAPLVATGNARA
jgi:glycosyltransferase involved in cell wall biosynthesis